MIVLCIDNDPEDIEFLFDAVKDVDSTITFLSALDGQEALELLSSIKDVQQLPDYIFLDVNMPRLDGRETLTEIRKDHRFHSVQIIMFSTGLTARDSLQFRQLGANQCMAKATSFQDLCDKLTPILKTNSD